MSAKDDLAFVNEAREAVSRPMQPASTNEKFLVASSGDMNRLLSLAERGARFTLAHEAVIEAAQPWGTNAQWCECRMCTMLEAAVTALNEQREKENGR